jgi:hypothetical protein
MKLMDQDQRKESRVNTHIVAEINVEGGIHTYCGYIENLSIDGMCVISLDKFQPDEQIALSFYLAGVLGKIAPKVSLVHSEKGTYKLYSHGFKFDSLTEKERRVIEQYVRENSLIRTA